MGSNAETLDFIQEQLTDIRLKKAAAAKAAEERGGTTHPVMQKADGTQAAPEGSRSQENTSDIKKDEGPASVDATQGLEGGGGDDNQMNIGLKAAPTGEDAASEDPDKIGKKEDADINNQSTSHPASGAVKESAHKQLGDRILAKIAMIIPKEAAEEESDKEPSDAVAENKVKTKEEGGSKSATASEDTAVKKTPADEKPKEASADFNAGKGAAKLAAEMLQKQAEAVQEVATTIEKKAEADAGKYVDFLQGYEEGLRKKAEGEGTPKEEVTDDEGQGDEEEKEEEAGAAAGAAEEAGAEVPLDAQGAIGDMLGAEEGGEMPPEMMGAEMGGGMPPEMGGGMPPEMGAEMGAEGGDIPPELLAALLQALQAEGAGPQGMEVAASMLKKAKVQSAKNRQLQMRKQAAYNKQVSFIRKLIQQTKQADAVNAPVV